MFVDKTKIEVIGGSGGQGCVCFEDVLRRHKRANGGNGGNGGDVVIIADASIQSLVDLKYAPRIVGNNGKHGGPNVRHGANGHVKYVKVPLGTIIKDLELSGIEVCDLDRDGQIFIAAKGGEKGVGNNYFLSNRNKVPYDFRDPEDGEKKSYELELKLIADLGLVGYPNAGKSTLISELTDAHPRIASYPFTTLNPIIGILTFNDYSRITIADIPGIIDGAHDDIGLGLDFLKHIERTKFLVFVLDMAGTDGRDPWDDYFNLRKELEFYNPVLLEKPAIIVANKMDTEKAEENLEILKEKLNSSIFPISAILGEGLPELKNYFEDNLGGIKETVEAEKSSENMLVDELTDIDLSEHEDFI
ncbi:MAG: Obg family GTPase CgtA [Verrucomicrobiota bacterium]|nr:Obg family GTPase CgtA [Verrucomicrobiota bacterium]